MTWFRFIILFVLGVYMVGFVIGCSFGIANAEPAGARQYRDTLIRESRSVWGMNAPIATMAGQIEQESGWKPDVCSAVACGLTQFTDDTASWIAGVHRDLGPKDVFNPAWAIRAMVTYDFDLHGQVPQSADDCACWAFVLSSYNGGLGNLRKDVKLCATDQKCNARKWWNNVERASARSISAYRENRAYPRTILLKRQAAYTGWGKSVPCSQPS